MAEKTCGLVVHLKSIPDPRRQCKNLWHKLEDILVIGFCGVLGAVPE
jgi:hypothetical protein